MDIILIVICVVIGFFAVVIIGGILFALFDGLFGDHGEAAPRYQSPPFDPNNVDDVYRAQSAYTNRQEADRAFYYDGDRRLDIQEAYDRQSQDRSDRYLHPNDYIDTNGRD